MSQQPTLVDYTPVHRPGLLAIWERYFGQWSGDRLTQRWAWQYENNPFAAQRAPKIIIALAGDQVIGHIGGYPLPIRINGQVYAGLGATGLVADESHRWLAFRLVRAMLAEPPVFASGMAQAAEELFIKCGSTIIPGCREEYFFPRRYEGELAAKLRWRLPQKAGVVLSPRMVGIASPWYCPKGQPRPFRMPAAPTSSTRRIDRFDAAYDALWQSSSKSLQLTIEKSSTYMNWRYVDCPTQRAVRIGQFAPDGTLTGVCIALIRVRLDRYMTPCTRIGQIVELIGQPDTDLSPALAAAMHEIDRSRVDAFSATCQPSYLHPTFTRLGFIHRSESEFSAAVNGPPNVKMGDLATPESTGYGGGDGDSLFTTAV